MFNFLVSYSGWPAGRRNIGRGRVFECTDDALVERFKPDRVLDVDAVIDLPTLFMSEAGGDGEQVARVGRIRRLRQVGTDYQLDYTFDADIPPVPIAKIRELASDLDIQGGELARTHWAVKDADLFEVLLRSGAALRPVPKVFNLVDEQINDDLVAVMMPFDASFANVYQSLRSAVAELGLTCQRADDIWMHDHILQDIIRLICTAKVVICDLTNKNANVFYEAGIAHTLGREVILITQSADHVPFDLRHIRYIHYLGNQQGLQRLSDDVKARLRTLTGCD